MLAQQAANARIRAFKEKERKVRDAMKQMGMRPLAHWLAWFAVAVLTNVVVSLVVTLTGLALGMDLFRENAFGLYFVHFLLMTTALTLWAFVCSTFLFTQDAARTFGIFWCALSSDTARARSALA